MAVTWQSIQEGQTLPGLDKQPGVTQLVKYAAGSGDFNPLHHDPNFPQAKQIGSIIVHGRFKYASLGELVSNWLGHNGRIQKIWPKVKPEEHAAEVLTALDARTP